ncbi:pyruvate dehydrogenase E2 component (dihydrolipoamide acetyltransferase) [Micromonospora kangleipakensis]|uniref:Dihydrolipoamide acetyltransferase component of pyruvate dehydrogenase complex n=1 Tax=Micromonospora kangleipakensis TaxID=1077942 RepID=A0A4Q8BB50_9ACTN|nr:dihydrolipoamide acetyltransferase family protein [Micromonospora kangleipakensis]RZU75010.1 pyruvate dehydrogenase E2 component (dihydrolipoamide acetyltransferase) [Micromonospora kangleipakensis]
MARLLRMPEVAANATEAILQDWTVEENIAFSAQDTILTVETDKAVVDIEADADGMVLRRLVPPGSKVDVGAPIAVLGDPGEQVGDLEALLTELGVGSGDAAGPVAGTAARLDPEGGTANTGAGALPEPALAYQVTTTNGEHRARIFASPLARRLAREAGLATETIHGTGPGGRILRRDVEAALAERMGARSGEPLRAPAEQPSTQPAVAVAGGVTEIPHSRMRRAIATRLTESKQSTPHFYVRATIDVRRLLKLRAELNDGADVKVSLNDLVVTAVGRAHALVPEMNVTWSPDAVRQYSAADVSVAVATERGLLTPVVRGVDSMTVTEVSRATRELAERARDGRLRQEELEGGTISVTNLGMFGTEEFAAIINPPQAAILAVGAVREEPVARQGKLRVRPVMRVTLSVDHRPVDGVVAARWMEALVGLLERPLRILA